LNLPFYIARRYIFSKKNRNVVNLISGISAFVIGLVTLSMVVVLSAINGIESLIDSLYTTFDSEVFVYPKDGRSIDGSTIDFNDILELEGVIAASPVIEDAVLVEYVDQRQVAKLKAIDPDFIQFTGLDSMIVWGDGKLTNDHQALLGYGLKYYLGIPGDPIYPMKLFAPTRGKSIKKYKEKAFETQALDIHGVFTISVEFDMQYIIAPLAFAEKLFDRENEYTHIEIRTSKEIDRKELVQELELLLGDSYKVITREQKNELIFQTTQSEKWASFAIITFVMIIAVFNVIASLTMLILEKRKDIFSLQSMGADSQMIRRIFFFEGIMINVIGAIGGMIMGIVLVMLQQEFHLIPLEGSIVDYYPVALKLSDMAIISLTVIVMASISTYLPVMYLSRKYLVKGSIEDLKED
jgi:ABC-type lipoprotein release transport system permease subunit